MGLTSSPAAVAHTPDSLRGAPPRLDLHGSAALAQRARTVLPGGVTNSGRYTPPHPVYISRAHGAYAYDVDGNRFIDYANGSTALLLGHSPAPVFDALRSAMERGLRLALEGPDTVELAELVCELVPCAERVRFEATGTLATMCAVRLARAATGRRILLKIRGGYHGRNTDLDLGVSFPFEEPEGAGQFPEQQRWVLLCSFNDIDDTRRMLDAAGSDLAAVIVEPVLGQAGFLPARPDYLAFLRDQTRRRGACLIFDEIITGFRVALGGAQQHYGVQPDLCTLGKVLGGGMPIGAVAGRAEILDWYAPDRPGGKTGRAILSSGTHSGHPLAVAAALATLRYLQQHRDEIYPVLERRTARLRAGLEVALAPAASRAGVAVRCHGTASGFVPLFLPPDSPLPENPEQIFQRTLVSLNGRLAHELARRGILTNLSGGTLSLAHTDADIDDTVARAREAATALDTNPAAPAPGAHGEPAG